MKTFIINLKRSVRRREHILREVTRCKLDYELTEAVDGRELSQEAIARWCDLEAIRQNRNWLTPGAIGCALSHYHTLRRIVEHNLPCAFILEDDVILPDNVGRLLREIEAEMEESEVVSLHYFSFRPCQLSRTGAVTLTGGNQLLYPIDLQQPLSAAGYVITQAAARKLSEMLLPIRATADSWNFFFKGGGFRSFRCVYPVPLASLGAKSEISATSQSWLRAQLTTLISDYNIPILSGLLRQMRLALVRSRSTVQLVDTVSPIRTEHS